ncbi:hypothetical protein ACFWPP_26355 [Streptomyces anulatus]
MTLGILAIFGVLSILLFAIRGSSTSCRTFSLRHVVLGSPGVT